MNKLFRYFLLIHLCTIVCVCFPQDTKDSLQILKVKNKQVLNILDSLIEHDKSCDFYDTNLVYTVYIQPTPHYGKYLISFSSSHKITKWGNEVGCFVTNQHVVIVHGVFNKALFKKTSYKKMFSFYQPQDGVDSNGNIIIDIYEDDTYTQWDYIFNIDDN